MSAMNKVNILTKYNTPKSETNKKNLIPQNANNIVFACKGNLSQ